MNAFDYPPAASPVSLELPAPLKGQPEFSETIGRTEPNVQRVPTMRPVTKQPNAENFVRPEVFSWYQYLRAVENDRLVEPEISGAARKAWEQLHRFLGDHLPGRYLPVPHAGPTAEGGLMIAWSVGDLYFEIEAIDAGRYDWLARDGEQDRTRYGEALTEGQVIARAVVELFKLYG